MILTLNSQKNDKDLIKKAAANKINWDFEGKNKYKYFLSFIISRVIIKL